MNVFYQTERLILNILPPLWAPAVLSFYKNNKDVLEGVEPARNSRFYTESFQKANLSVEYNSFFKNNYMNIVDKLNLVIDKRRKIIYYICKLIIHIVGKNFVR